MFIDWTDIGDIAAFASVAAVVFTIALWFCKRFTQRITLKVRGWIQAQLDGAVAEISKHLTNDEVSVAKYAHEARDAALRSEEASLSARSAALDAKDAARDAAESTEKIHQAIIQVGNLLKERNV